MSTWRQCEAICPKIEVEPEVDLSTGIVILTTLVNPQMERLGGKEKKSEINGSLCNGLAKKKKKRAEIWIQLNALRGFGMGSTWKKTLNILKLKEFWKEEWSDI